MQNSPAETGAQPPMEIAQFHQKLSDFHRELKRAKASLETELQPYLFYPFDTIGSLLLMLESLPTAVHEQLSLESNHRICDIGCGDGDLSFFLESLGRTVDAVDFPDTNYNKMNGVRLLAARRRSTISISEVDLNSGFSLPKSSYDLTLLLGVLYHVKNPYYVLEQIARNSDTCILSTRIADVSPDKSAALIKQPIAFLVDDTELNADTTNYWIFTEAGLRRLLHRAGWSIAAWRTVGCTEGSDPISAAGDARAFCILRSRLRPAGRLQLGEGWHALEQNRYRWTQQNFSMVVPRLSDSHTILRFQFVAPEPIMAQGSPLVLSAEVNGVALESATYDADGLHVYESPLPPLPKGSTSAPIHFHLGHAIPPSPGDPRELGIIAAFYDWSAGRYEFTSPATLEIPNHS